MPYRESEQVEWEREAGRLAEIAAGEEAAKRAADQERYEQQIGQLVEVLTEAHAVLDSEYDSGLQNGYWPTILPLMEKIHKVLGLPPQFVHPERRHWFTKGGNDGISQSRA